jgi:glucosylceramidase
MSPNSSIFKIAILGLLVSFGSTASSPCQSRDYGNGSPVCVCDAKSCDTVAPVEPVGENQAAIYTSDKSGRRLERKIIQMRSIKGIETANVTLDPSERHQSIDGFGGAFTDAAGINIASLPPPAQELLMRSYFSKEGIEYTVGRIPVSSTDFSTREYSYDDVANDFELKNFALTDEDLKYKIPYIKAAQKYTSRPIRFFGSSWSAPAWMKNTGRMGGNSTLLGEPKPGDKYYTTFANYYVKFLQEYAKHNISFWALTGQNEPASGFVYLVPVPWQTQGFTAEMQRDFIKNNLGPALHQNGFESVSIMIMDDQRYLLPAWPRTVLHDAEVRKYVSHIAVHYYSDQRIPPDVLDTTHREFPNVPMLATEACVGDQGPPHVILGSWERAEQYCHDIIEDLNHWFVGWVDWNIALSLDGGPNWAKNNVDSPIIVNTTSGEFYKQPMFYALGHFSKFLPPKSFRIGLKSNTNSSKLEMTAFKNVDGYKTVILMNKENVDTKLVLAEAKKDQVVDVPLPARSIVTVLWK